MISTRIRTGQFYVKTAIIHQLKRLCVPDCTYTESMFINFIHISLYDISLMWKSLYQTKRDVAVWKRLGCPQRKQRTWWQILETPYTGLAWSSVRAQTKWQWDVVGSNPIGINYFVAIKFVCFWIIHDYFKQQRVLFRVSNCWNNIELFS